MNTKTKEGARNKGNPYFLRVPWNKGGLVNTGPGVHIILKWTKTLQTTDKVKILKLPSQASKPLCPVLALKMSCH